MLRRACRLSSEFATATKRHEIARLLQAYRGAVNFCVGSLWEDPGALDKETLARLPPERTRLQSKQKDHALRQVLAIVSSTHRSAKALGAEPRSPRPLHQSRRQAIAWHRVSAIGFEDLYGLKRGKSQSRDAMGPATRVWHHRRCVDNRWNAP